MLRSGIGADSLSNNFIRPTILKGQLIGLPGGCRLWGYSWAGREALTLKIVGAPNNLFRENSREIIVDFSNK